MNYNKDERWWRYLKQIGNSTGSELENGRNTIYKPEEFTFEVMKEYGIYAVRGPRGIPNSLIQEYTSLAGL